MQFESLIILYGKTPGFIILVSDPQSIRQFIHLFSKVSLIMGNLFSEALIENLFPDYSDDVVHKCYQFPLVVVYYYCEIVLIYSE